MITVFASICSINDKDFFYFNVDQTYKSVEIYLYTGRFGDLDLAFYNSSGHKLATSSNGGLEAVEVINYNVIFHFF